MYTYIHKYTHPWYTHTPSYIHTSHLPFSPAADPAQAVREQLYWLSYSQQIHPAAAACRSCIQAGSMLPRFYSIPRSLCSCLLNLQLPMLVTVAVLHIQPWLSCLGAALRPSYSSPPLSATEGAEGEGFVSLPHAGSTYEPGLIHYQAFSGGRVKSQIFNPHVFQADIQLACQISNPGVLS